MKRFINNLSTNAKLFFSFGIILILLAAVIVSAYVGITQITRSEQALYDIQFQTALQIEQFRAHQNYLRGQVLAMLSTPGRSDQDVIESTVRDRYQKIDGILASVVKLNPDAEYQKLIKQLSDNRLVYRQGNEDVFTLIHSGQLDEARRLLLGVQTDRYTQMQALMTEVETKAMAGVDSQITSDMQAGQSSIRLLVIMGVFALLLATGLIVLLNQTIASPLNAISKVAGQIAAGDLSVSIPVDQRRDEVGALAQAFRRMVETLRRSTADIAQAVNLLGSSASEILAATTQVASGTAETATSISETTTTVEEVRQAAQLSSQKAQSVSDSAQRVAQVSQNGQRAVEETAAGMARIREQMETIAQTIVRLSEQSQFIGGIIASVTDLANQSNLLAVNAAIEAAKAGEQGKGFAVVAQEIKSLAEQSKQATGQVRGILSDVQKATSNAVMATEQGSKAVDAGVKQAAQAGEAIRALAETSGEAVQTAIQIVTSSQQQVVGMDQIGVAMENINQAGAQNASSMKQMEVAAQNLHELGEKLTDLVAQFKL